MSATELGVTTMSVRSGRLLSTLFLVGISLFVTFCNLPSAFAGEPQWMEIRSPHFLSSPMPARRETAKSPCASSKCALSSAL